MPGVKPLYFSGRSRPISRIRSRCSTLIWPSGLRWVSLIASPSSSELADHVVGEAAHALSLLAQHLRVAVREDPGQRQHVCDPRLREAPIAVERERVARTRHHVEGFARAPQVGAIALDRVD